MTRSFAPLAALAGLTLFAAAPAQADAPTFSERISGWAADVGYRVTTLETCESEEEKAFGGSATSCFYAEKIKVKKGDLRPGMGIVEANYGSEAGAKARIAKLCAAPPGEDLEDEGHKSYPLRAAFRLNDRVIVLTTHAFAFRGDIDRAAAELAAKAGGTDVTRWKDCAR